MSYLKGVAIDVGPFTTILEFRELQSGFGFNGSQTKLVSRNLDMDYAVDCFSDLGHHNSLEGVSGRMLALAFALTIPKDMIP